MKIYITLLLIFILLYMYIIIFALLLQQQHQELLQQQVISSKAIIINKNNKILFEFYLIWFTLHLSSPFLFFFINTPVIPKWVFCSIAKNKTAASFQSLSLSIAFSYLFFFVYTTWYLFVNVCRKGWRNEFRIIGYLTIWKFPFS